MIKAIAVISRAAIQRIIRGSQKVTPRWHLISIHTDRDNEGARCGPIVTPESEPVLKAIGCQSTLSLRFWDISKLDDEVKEKYPSAILFNDDHATQVIDYLDGLKKEEEDSMLVVHCFAGISRSGAIGGFACDYFGMDYLPFAESNPCIMPNAHISGMLRRVAGMTPSDRKHWDDENGIFIPKFTNTEGGEDA